MFGSVKPDRESASPAVVAFPALAAPALSRALLTPGPLPPLSHLGVTLLRHAVGTGLRYALYQLGLPLPEAPPVRIVRLRLYLDDGKLALLLADAPGGAEVVAALSDPGGAGTLPPGARALATAAALHRARLHLFSALPAGRPVDTTGSPAELLARFRDELSRGLPRTSDALLADLLSALARRARRAKGQEIPPALSRSAHRLLTGRTVDLHRFGPPDLFLPSWAATPERAEAARREAPAASPMLPHDPLRGRFREAYRVLLDRLAPLYRAVAATATARGLLDTPEDAFFLPLDLAGDLTQECKPSWLESGVRANRAEYESARKTTAPPERITGPEEGVTVLLAEPRDWELGPVLPLP